MVASTISITGAVGTVLTALFFVVRASRSSSSWEQQRDKQIERDTRRNYQKMVDSRHLTDEAALRWAFWWSQRGMAIFYFLVGILLVSGPDYLFGPTWFYFQHIPHGGFGIGVACLGLCVAMTIGVRLRSNRIVTWVFFAGGIAFWISAFLIGAQGIMAKTGCMESPFMMYAACDMLLRGAVARR
jgi:hypothetical protein